MQISLALLANDKEKANKIVATAIGGAAQQIINIANSYDPADIPFVVIAMKLLQEVMYNSLDESGKNIVTSVSENTTCIAVDAEMLKRMFDHGEDQEQ